MTKMAEEERVRESVEREWLDVEKKIYNWVLMCYLHLRHSRIEDLVSQNLPRQERTTRGCRNCGLASRFPS